MVATNRKQEARKGYIVTRIKNCQQYDVYAAERAVSQGYTFASVHAVETYINDVLCESWWWENWCANVERVNVRHGSESCARFDVGTSCGDIQLAPYRPSEQLVIHELAHVLASARRCSQSLGPWYARVYYELTYLVRGSDAAAVLANAFESEGVDYDAKGIAP